MSNSNLPFELSEQSIANWLLTLSQLSSVNSANELNKAIQKLRKTNHTPKQVLAALTQLTPTILFICNDIESSLLSEKAKPTEKTSRKIEKLGIQLLRNLSLAFCTLAKNESFSTEEKHQVLYFALQLIGFTQRITLIFHENPSSTLWKKSAEIFTLTQNASLTLQEVKLKIKEFKNSTTIESVLKRNLLFAISSSYQFNSRQIQELFVISEQQSQLLKLNQQNPTGNTFVWDMENGQLPSLHNSRSAYNNAKITLDPAAYIAFIQSKNFSSEYITENVLTQLINMFSGFKSIINSMQSTEFTINNLITGYAEIIDYLNKIEKLNKIQKMSAEMAEAMPLRKLTLEPFEFEKNHLTPVSEPSPSLSHIELPKNAQTVKILKTIHKQYIIAISSISAYSIGDIILLCNPNAEPSLGIIRQLKPIENAFSLQLLIEIIDGKPLSSIAHSTKLRLEQIILIHKKSSPPQIIIPPCKLSNGTPIRLANKQILVLDKLIDCNPFYMHYLTYLNEDLINSES